MSLEECKLIAERRLKRAQAHAKIEGESRHAEGIVDGGHVKVSFYAEHIGMSFQTWIVAVLSKKHDARSKKTFHMQMKTLAIEYFEELVQEYGLEEAECQ